MERAGARRMPSVTSWLRGFIRSGIGTQGRARREEVTFPHPPFNPYVRFSRIRSPMIFLDRRVRRAGCDRSASQEGHAAIGPDRHRYDVFLYSEETTPCTR